VKIEEIVEEISDEREGGMESDLRIVARAKG
jgi:hypothetical protein